VDLGDDAFFFVGIDRAQIMANIDRQVTLAYAVISAAVLFAMFAAVWGSERAILSPLRALAQKAVRYGQGNFTVTPAVVKWPPEFVPLNHALEQMAQQLAAREHQLLEENRQLDYLAQVDGLTGVPNRRCFDERLRTEWAASALNNRPLSLLMIDVDHFKRFNDRYGHARGDSCLKAIAACITRGGLRANDFVARYGGEEFAVVLPSLAPEAALEIAERLRQAVFDLAVENTQSPIARVTISVGVAGLVPDEAHDAGALIEAADAALYNAKRRGRNVVSGRTSKLIDILAG
jgi:diguanylate cyclase (GGDEF)-like protein